MKRLNLLTAFALLIGCLSSGCTVQDLAHGDVLSPQVYIPEAYIKLTDQPTSTLSPEKQYPTAQPAAQGNDSDENSRQTQEPTATTGVSLAPAGFDGLDLYRLNGSNYLITRPLEEDTNIKISLKNCADLLNELQEKHQDVSFYTYYITRATDCDWYSSTESLTAYDYESYFEEMLGPDTKITSARYMLADLQDYMDTGYKTDFHVNYKGSLRVYQDVYNMLSKDMELSDMLAPVAELDFGGLKMIGDLFDTSGTWQLTDDEMDDFKVYQYNYGNFTSFVDDKQMTIGLEDEYAAGQIDRDPRFGHQFSYYGGQSGVVRFEFNQPDKPNLLILSDSQGRPSRKLLASHFNRTVFLDDIQWRSMDLDKIIEENDISVVILMGQISMFEIYNE